MTNEYHPSPETRRAIAWATACLIALVGGASFAYSWSKRDDYLQVVEERNRILAVKDQLIARQEAEIRANSTELAALRTRMDEMRTMGKVLLALIEESPYPTAALDASGKVIFWNAAAQIDSGYTFEEMKASGIEALIPIDMQAAHRESSSAALADPTMVGRKMRVTCRRVRKNGKSREVEVALQFYMDGGQVVAVATWLPLSKVDEIEVSDSGVVTEVPKS